MNSMRNVLIVLSVLLTTTGASAQAQIDLTLRDTFGTLAQTSTIVSQDTILFRKATSVNLDSLTNDVHVLLNGQEVRAVKSNTVYSSCAVLFKRQRPYIECLSNEDTWHFVFIELGHIAFTITNKTFEITITVTRRH